MLRRTPSVILKTRSSSAGKSGSLVKLIAMEGDERLRQNYRAGLAVNARGARAALGTHQEFDNNDTQLYGDARWREVFVPWKPQKTQAEAEQQSKVSDKAKRGTRKHYEARFMRNPLAAAAIAAMTGDGEGRAAIEQTTRHYNYSRLYRSEFFFAECAYYALPPTAE